MQYNFDELIDRRGSNSIKYDDLKNRWGRTDLQPMWVADGDFASCPVVMERLRERLAHPVLGYSLEPEGWRPAIERWMQQRYAWTVDPKDLMFIPGIVRGIAYVLVHACKRGDSVCMFSPVYMPFFQVPAAYDIVVKRSPLRLVDGRYEIDFDNLAKALEGCKYFILSNPHNPGGRVWEAWELVRIADLCAKAGAKVISDEIHADLTLPGHRHIPFATVSETAQKISISFFSPSKAFNIPGLASSYAIIPKPELRMPFNRFMTGGEFNVGHLFAYIATEAAYTPEGEEWLNQLLHYLQANIDFAIDYIKRKISGIAPMRPEASFLIFLDCRGLGLDDDALGKLFVDGARLALNEGRTFGPGGEGFMRLNVACPRTVLAQALEQLSHAVKAYGK